MNIPHVIRIILAWNKPIPLYASPLPSYVIPIRISKILSRAIEAKSTSEERKKQQSCLRNSCVCIYLLNTERITIYKATNIHQDVS